MSLAKLSRPFVAILMTLYLALQFTGSLHAAQYGDFPHDHDGIACAVSATMNNEIAVLPPQSTITCCITGAAPAYIFAYISAPYLSPQGRAPPPRSPPVLV